MALNWVASAASSDEPARTSARGMRLARSPLASAREASVNRRSGVVTRSAIAAATRTEMPSASNPTAAVTVVTLSMAACRNVYGFDRRTSITYGKSPSVAIRIRGLARSASFVRPWRLGDWTAAWKSSQPTSADSLARTWLRTWIASFRP